MADVNEPMAEIDEAVSKMHPHLGYMSLLLLMEVLNFSAVNWCHVRSIKEEKEEEGSERCNR
jgi:hypothetical protein